MGKVVAKIVLTGGPCAGKTSALACIENYFTEKGYKVLIVGESATEIIKGGIRPFGNDKMDIKLFQEKIYEDSVGKFDNKVKCIILYDRGMLDNKAYINQQIFKELLEKEGLKELELMDSYDMVLHLVTAADGAEEFYTLGNNSARTETVEEAKALDQKTINAWAGHSNLKIITNEGSFEAKLEKVVSEINKLIGEPLLVKHQRKYLINLKDKDLEFLNEDNSTKINITQYYINANDKAETRLRIRELDGEKTYYLTVQVKSKNGVSSVLTDKKITAKEFNKILSSYDDYVEVRKIRYCFTLDKVYYRLDLFENGEAVLEVNPSSEYENVRLSDRFEIIDEVTDNPYYDNHVIATLEKKVKKKVRN